MKMHGETIKISYWYLPTV